ncbi:hypothetical protein AAFF_G00193710 [Aldrovandia affinis]|uniref:Uncharacterized protein n=1 Tax=Aldrovandia affinis TaxID=143900 RepID=A0AAD7SYJ5_9TELE|nr:hypothetical protein AAFF_G00193710 [Aldrovandia affinis]
MVLSLPDLGRGLEEHFAEDELWWDHGVEESLLAMAEVRWDTQPSPNVDRSRDGGGGVSVVPEERAPSAQYVLASHCG